MIYIINRHSSDSGLYYLIARKILENVKEVKEFAVVSTTGGHQTALDVASGMVLMDKLSPTGIDYVVFHHVTRFMVFAGNPQSVSEKMATVRDKTPAKRVLVARTVEMLKMLVSNYELMASHHKFYKAGEKESFDGLGPIPKERIDIIAWVTAVDRMNIRYFSNVRNARGHLTRSSVTDDVVRAAWDVIGVEEVMTT